MPLVLYHAGRVLSVCSAPPSRVPQFEQKAAVAETAVPQFAQGIDARAITGFPALPVSHKGFCIIAEMPVNIGPQKSVVKNDAKTVMVVAPVAKLCRRSLGCFRASDSSDPEKFSWQVCRHFSEVTAPRVPPVPGVPGRVRPGFRLYCRGARPILMFITIRGAVSLPTGA